MVLIMLMKGKGRRFSLLASLGIFLVSICLVLSTYKWNLVRRVHSISFLTRNEPENDSVFPSSVLENPAGDQFTTDGFTDVVQWDNYSLIVKGQRIFLQYVRVLSFDFLCSNSAMHHSSGEFHTFRLPVPSLWLDILQKAKAAGLNAVSVYTHCEIMSFCHFA